MRHQNEDYARKLSSDGLRRDRAAPTISYHPVTDVRVVVHGDDFTFVGTDVESKTTQVNMREWKDVKLRGCFLASRARMRNKVKWRGERSEGRMTGWSTKRTRHSDKHC